MTKEEFLNYLENNKLNFQDFINYLDNKYFDAITFFGYLPTSLVCREYNFEISESDLNQSNLIKGGQIYCKNDVKRINVSKELSYRERNYLILYLLYKYLENYKFLKDGGELVASAILDENNNIIYNIENFQKAESKIIELPKKY